MATPLVTWNPYLLIAGIISVTQPFAASATEPQAGEASTTDSVDVVELQTIVVSARLQGVSAFNAPMSLSVIDAEAASRIGVNLSEFLSGVPGVTARDRQNYAQDTQLSIRGFGSRSTFGVRSLRLYADGIPATMPDGQGQVSHFNMLGSERVEVLRGPFSALYGNSSGGVIQSWSAPATEAPEFLTQASYGGNAAWTLAERIRGKVGVMGYNVAVQHFATDGYRDHSAATRNSGNAKFDFDLHDAGTLGLVFNSFDSQAQDPLGLTRDQAQQNPRHSTSVATTYNTRKSVRQNQLGAIYDRPFGDGNTLHATVYGGQRSVLQYLSIPPGAQANPLHSGGVVDLDSEYAGTDLRWTKQTDLAGRPLEFSLGVNAEQMRQRRSGYEDFTESGGSQVLGVRGNLRRNEKDNVTNFDQYAQLWWQFAPRWSLLLGARHSDVRFVARDHYITSTNPDDSGRKRYARTSPVAGIEFAASDGWRLHVSAGQGFETPSFNEMSYRADGGAGLAFDLKPAVSRNLEIGSKWRSHGGMQIEAALFRADTNNELGVASNIGGRSSYHNVGRARRQGVEISASVPFTRTWSGELAYTFLNATFRDGFIQSGADIAAGSRIPGIARQQVRAALNWRDENWRTTLEGIGSGDVVANDAGTAIAPGYFIVNASVSHGWRFGRDHLTITARLDNLLDKAYIGSVIVNESNGRYYEPAPRCGVSLLLRWAWGGDN